MTDTGVRDARAAARLGEVVGRSQPRGGLARISTPEEAAAARVALAEYLDIPADALEAVADQNLLMALRRVRGLAARAAELEARATIDDLTGVLRRGAGLTCLQEELARSRRLDVPLVVAFIDVDGLKQLNDSQGHQAGDAALCAVASVLRRGVRSYDCVLRYGGDEFVCGLLGAGLAGARRLLDLLGAEIAADSGGVTVSVGLAEAQTDDDTVESVIARADADLLARRRRVARSSRVASPQ